MSVDDCVFFFSPKHTYLLRCQISYHTVRVDHISKLLIAWPYASLHLCLRDWLGNIQFLCLRQKGLVKQDLGTHSSIKLAHPLSNLRGILAAPVVKKTFNVIGHLYVFIRRALIKRTQMVATLHLNCFFNLQIRVYTYPWQGSLSGPQSQKAITHLNRWAKINIT